MLRGIGRFPALAREGTPEVGAGLTVKGTHDALLAALFLDAAGLALAANITRPTMLRVLAVSGARARGGGWRRGAGPCGWRRVARGRGLLRPRGR